VVRSHRTALRHRYCSRNPTCSANASGAKATAAPPYPITQTFLLHSKAGSQKTIYLDFDGEVVTNSAWSPTSPINASAFDLDSNPTNWTLAEHAIVQGVYDRVSEDYAPFDVDVTTQLPPLAKITRANSTDQQFGIRALITSTPSTTLCSSCGGVAFVGTFNLIAPNDTKYQPAWIFPGSLSNDEKFIAEAVTHEVGHNLNLLHDGRTVPVENYYLGANSWAPILGVGYYQPIVQFSNGDYPNADNTQDDFAVMGTKGLGIRVDEAGDTNASAVGLCNKGTVVAAGVIATRTDSDWFSFTANAGWTVNVTATAATTSPNLDIELKLHNSAGAGPSNNPVSATLTPDLATGMGAGISYVVPVTGTYYVKVDGIGRAGSYSDYGSVGRYRLTVTKPAPNNTCFTINTTLNTAPPPG
jgi:hypothetical protein